ncbi:DUF4190 domain-containing protein [Kitasatospora sp. NPDC051853]|uniref:DUF4190 domain-containing protein n=1 Tax=Kitasatospora sp. NPDC051853 TaxID=3364058 RepID=UPI003792D7B4
MSSEPDQSSQPSATPAAPDWSPPADTGAPAPAADPYAYVPPQASADPYGPSASYGPSDGPYGSGGSYGGAPYGGAAYDGGGYGGAPYGDAAYGAAPYPGAPYPGAPYPGQPVWQGPPPPAPGTNGMAVASLVLGILGLFCLAWTLGLGLGIAALRQLKRRPQRGKGMAVAGIVLSSCWALVTLALAPYFVEGIKEGVQEAGSRAAVFDLKAGDCMKEATGHREVRARFTVVPCSEPHHGEVFGVVHLPGTDHPGTSQLERTVSLQCIGPQYAYTPDHWSIPATVESTSIYPDREAWPSTKRAICLFDSDRPRTGTLRQDRSRLTAEQSGYLEATRELNVALAGAPTEEVEDATDDYQAWGRTVADAATTAKSKLARVPWGKPDRPELADLQSELDRVVTQAKKLGETGDEDVDALYDAYDGLDQNANGEADALLRQAIGLRSTPPDERPAQV